MTTVELLAYCKDRTQPPRAPDLVWQRLTHHNGVLQELRNGNSPTQHTGFHDTNRLILEPCSWLVARKRKYPTLLFTKGTTCSKPQK